MEKNCENDQYSIMNKTICLKCHKFFTQTKEFSLTLENDFDLLSFNFCDKCRNSADIDDHPTAFALWMSTWLEEYIKNKGDD